MSLDLAVLCLAGSMLSVYLDYSFCQPEKLSWAHSGQELGRLATVEVPSSLPDRRAQRRGTQTASPGRRGLPHVGAAAPAGGLEGCNQAWGISAWFTMSDCWNAQTSALGQRA